MSSRVIDDAALTWEWLWSSYYMDQHAGSYADFDVSAHWRYPDVQTRVTRVYGYPRMGAADGSWLKWYASVPVRYIENGERFRAVMAGNIPWFWIGDVSMFGPFIPVGPGVHPVPLPLAVCFHASRVLDALRSSTVELKRLAADLPLVLNTKVVR